MPKGLDSSTLINEIGGPPGLPRHRYERIASLTKELPSSEEPRQQNTISSRRVTQSERAGSRSEVLSTKRQTVPSKIIDSEEFRIEKAIDLKTRRAGHLGDVTRKLNLVQDHLAGVQGSRVAAVVRALDTF